MSRVVKPTSHHVCIPGWERRYSDDLSPERGVAVIAGTDLPAHHVPEPGWYLHDLQLREGALWICGECGQGWLGYRPYMNVWSNSWKREGRFARRRRLKAERLANAQEAARAQ